MRLGYGEIDKRSAVGLVAAGKYDRFEQAAPLYLTNSKERGMKKRDGLEKNFWQRLFYCRFCGETDSSRRAYADQFRLIRFGRNRRGDQVRSETGFLQEARARHDHDLRPQ